MTYIMRGTTPTITITVDSDELSLSDVTSLELYIKNGSVITTYTEDDVTIDTDANTIVYTFTEDETTDFDTNYNVIVQARFFTSDTVYGTKRLTYGVASMAGI